MATDTTGPNPSNGGATNANDANAPGGESKRPRKKVEMPPELDQLMKELAGDTNAAGTNTVGRLERRLNILEAAFADIVERHEGSLRDRSAQLAAVEGNVLALRNRIDQSDKQHMNAASELRSALGDACVRLNGLEARRQEAPSAAPAPVPLPATESSPPESAAPVWTAEQDATPPESDAPQEEPTAPKRSIEGPDYLSAARRAANASVRETDTLARAAADVPRRANRVRLALLGCAAPLLVLAGAAFFLNRHPVTAQPAPLAATAPKQADALPIRRVQNTPPPDVAVAAPADPVPADIVSTAPWDELQDKAGQGDAAAARDLGLKYLTGDGVAANEEEAARWILEAAYSGEPGAEYWLGTLYARGRGVPEDESQALHWYESAAKQGNRQAMHRLGVAYFAGQSVAKDEAEAARWFGQAAELGNIDSAFNLAVLYERGAGVKQSRGDAYKWYAIAARQGDKESTSRVETLAKELKPAELQAATRETAEFKPKSAGVASSN